MAGPHRAAADWLTAQIAPYHRPHIHPDAILSA